MSSPKSRCKNALIAASVVLVTLFLVASLPVLAVISVLLRGAILAIAIAALTVAGIAYWFSPRFRLWCASCLDTQTEYKGVRLRDDVALAPGHTWVRTSPHNATIGPDDLVQLALGPLDWVWLPAAGTWVAAGGPLITLGAGNRELELCAPISGRVRRVNHELLKHPIRANEDPYGAGWAVDLDPEAANDGTRLKHGCHARQWMRHEVDRFLATLQDSPGSALVMADGGVLVADLNRALSDETWQRLRDEFFGASSLEQEVES
jgi:glycine cleavage system H protein